MPPPSSPSSKLLSARILDSAFLVLVSAVVALPLSIALGVWMAVKRDKLVDNVLSMVTLSLASLPEFVIGLLLLVLLATNVSHVFPAMTIIPPGEHAWNVPKAVVLPAATLVLAVTPYISRIMRGSMIEVLESEYVTMARLKGLSNRTVIWRHAVPNAIVPAIQVSALQLAYLAGGVVLVEYVFGFPGIGSALVDGVGNRDIPVVQALVIIIAAVYVFVNLVADLLTIVVTPRLRTAEADEVERRTPMTAPTMTADRRRRPPAMRNRQWTTLLRATLHQWRGRIGSCSSPPSWWWSRCSAR